MNGYRPAWLVKPTHACNFDCKYCYDKNMRNKYGDMVMPMEVWEKIVKLAGAYNAQIVFHGGEPLMVGADWYQEAFSIAEKHGCNFGYGMQTNGSLLDECYIDLFRKHRVGVGISYDFVAQSDYRGADVLHKIRLAKELDFGVGCICVVTRKNIDDLVSIFELAANELSGRQISFNPLYHSGNTRVNNMTMLSTEDLKRGFNEFFRYYKDCPNKLFRERTAETYMQMVTGRSTTVCFNNDCRGMWVGVSPNGDIYPCDHEYGEEYMYGNILDFENVIEFTATAGFSKYYRDVAKRFDNHCSKCRYSCICNGGCNGVHLSGSGKLSTLNSSECNKFHTLYSIALEVWGI